MNFSTAFILCKPDLFLRGLLPKFLTSLEEQNFFIKEFFCGKVTSNHFRLMYTAHFRYDVDDWQHNQKLYEFGPALGLLLSNSTTTSPLSALNSLKGAALPSERKIDSLRYLFGSKSRLFNLLHVPDQIEHSYTEALHWFGVNKWEEGSSYPISKKEVLNEIEQNGYHSIGSLDPEYAFLKAKIRLMHAIQKRAIVSNTFHSTIQSLKIFYTLWAEEVSTSPLFNGIEGTILTSRYKEEQERLLALQELLPLPSPILSSLRLLLLLPAKPKFATNFFWILDEWHVFVSPLEQYLITSRLKYSELTTFVLPTEAQHCT